MIYRIITDKRCPPLQARSTKRRVTYLYRISVQNYIYYTTFGRENEKKVSKRHLKRPKHMKINMFWTKQNSPLV